MKLDQVDLDKMEAIVDTHEGVLRIEAPLKGISAQGPGEIKLNIDRGAGSGETKKIDS